MNDVLRFGGTYTDSVDWVVEQSEKEWEEDRGRKEWTGVHSGVSGPYTPT